MLQCLCPLSTSVFFLSASVHPHSVHLCCPLRHFMPSIVSPSLLCISCESYSFPSLSLSCFCCACLLSPSLFFLSFPLSHRLVVYWGQRKGIVYYCQHKRSHIQFLFMKKKLKMNDFSVFFTSHYFQLPMLPAVGQMNNINYQGDIHERIKW